MALYKQIYNDVLLTQRICFFLQNGVVKHEKEGLLQQLRGLIASNNPQIKIIVAEALCHSAQLPSDIVLMLCREQMLVAAPLLQHSPQLNEAMLIKLARIFRSSKKILILAKRKDITTPLANLLVRLGNVDVTPQLIHNKYFVATPSQVAKIIKSHAHNRTLIDEIIDSRNFDESEWQDVLYNLDSHLRQEISAIIGNRVNLEMSEHCYVQHMLSMHNISLHQHLDVLYSKGMLDSSTLFNLLQEGEVYGFIFGIAKLSESSFFYVRQKLMEQWKESDFMKFYYLAELPMADYEMILNLFKEIHQHKHDHKFFPKECATLVQRSLLESERV